MVFSHNRSILSSSDQVVLGLVMLIVSAAMQLIATPVNVIPPYVHKIIAEFKSPFVKTLEKFYFTIKFPPLLSSLGFVFWGMKR